MGSGKYDVYVVPHSHIDVEWYWSYEKTKRFSRDILNSALGFLESDTGYVFTQDQAAIFRVQGGYELEKIRDFIAENRFGAVGGMIVQPEVAEPNGECLVRQILLGGKWFEENLGIRPTCAWNIDTFGQCVQLPQILSKSGHSAFVFWRGVNSEIFEELPSDFYYRAPDGSKILTHWLCTGYSVGDSNLEDALKVSVKHAPTDKVLIPWGGDLYRPCDGSEEIISCVRDAARRAGIPLGEVVLAAPSHFFEQILKSSDELPEVEIDLNPPLSFMDLRGSYSNRIGLKLKNREAESTLMSAENFSSIASMLGAGHPISELSMAWRNLLHNHFHDIIGGSCTDDVYLRAMGRFGCTVSLARDALEDAIDFISMRADTSGLDMPIVVFNPTSFERTDVCTYQATFRGDVKSFQILDENGEPVSFHIAELRSSGPDGGNINNAVIEFPASDIPAFGFKVYSIEVSDVRKKEKVLKSDSLSIANEFFRVELDRKSGHLKSIFDVVNEKEILEVGSRWGNELLAVVEENPNLEGELHLTDTVYRSSDFRTNSISCSENPVYSSLKIEGDFKYCRRIQEIFLYKGIPRIDFRTTIEDFKGGDLLIKVSFPLNIDLSSMKVVYETPYAPVERPEGYYCAQSWVDCSDGGYGAALMNRGTSGYWVEGNSLDMVLMRSVGDFRDYYAPLAAEHGTHIFSYSLYPHRGTWEGSGLVRVAHAFSRPLIPWITTSHAGDLGRSWGFLKASSENFEVVSVKKAEDGRGYVVRGYETEGKNGPVSLEFSVPISRAWTANLVEEKLSELTVKKDTVSFSPTIFEIVTLRVE